MNKIRTYKQLKEELEKLSEEQLLCKITVYIPALDEYFARGYRLICSDDKNDVLDQGHPVLY